MTSVYRCHACDRGLGIRREGLAPVIVVKCRRCKRSTSVDADAGAAGDEVRCGHAHRSLPDRPCGFLLARRTKRRQVLLKCWTCKIQRLFPRDGETRMVRRLGRDAGRDLTAPVAPP